MRHNKDPQSRHTFGQRATVVTIAGTLAALAVFGGRNNNANTDSGQPQRSPEPSIGYFGHGAPFWESGKDKQGKFTFFAKKVLPFIRIQETSDGGLTATEGGIPVSLNISLPLEGSHEGYNSRQMFKAAADETAPGVDYFIPSNDLSATNATESKDGRTNTFTPAGPGEPISILQDGHGGLVAEHNDRPVVANIHLPAPGPNQK
jgi:hypothetical protein